MAGFQGWHELSLDAGSEQRTSSRHSYNELSNDDEVIISQAMSDGAAYVNIDHSDLGDYPSVEMSTSAVLHCCKKRVLHPYLRLLSLLGWRPLMWASRPQTEPVIRIVNVVYILVVFTVIFTGYVFQYAACYRRDNFVSSKEIETSTSANDSALLEDLPDVDGFLRPRNCEGNFVSIYVFPDFLHFLAYVYMMYLMYHPENEQVQILMERVFLQSVITQAMNQAQQRLIKMLRSFLTVGAFWLLVSVISQIIHVTKNSEIYFTWMEWKTPFSDNMRVFATIMMVATLTCNDMICIGVATSYSVHCQLIMSYLNNLCSAVREKCINFQEFVREIQESKKFLKYLNDSLSVSISLLIMSFGCQIISGIYGLLTGKTEHPLATRDNFDISSGILTIVLWIILIMFPILQAARLMESCRAVKKLGHELRARPFGYLDTPQKDLDSLLIYTSTLKLKVKMFHLPVKASCLMLGVSSIFFIIIILGQINVITF